jgi:hypothetical protein
VDLPGLKSGRSPFVTENGLSTPNTWRFFREKMMINHTNPEKPVDLG